MVLWCPPISQNMVLCGLATPASVNEYLHGSQGCTSILFKKDSHHLPRPWIQRDTDHDNEIAKC